ncbi:uncharacterized protein TNCV_4600211 [Trichonephila clavipes]|nr:uncharacterized protein TNCV_4600211 [Trichonephila clavipes]
MGLETPDLISRSLSPYHSIRFVTFKWCRSNSRCAHLRSGNFLGCLYLCPTRSKLQKLGSRPQMGELKELFKERNKARKTTGNIQEHPQHKTELNRLQNAIKRKIYHYRQQAWEDNLSTLNAEDNSLWGIAKLSGRKPPRFPPLMALTGIALSDTNKTEPDSTCIKENILIPEQHGFRPRLSHLTSTSPESLNLLKKRNNKDECGRGLLDIQKAFDRV